MLMIESEALSAIPGYLNKPAPLLRNSRTPSPAAFIAFETALMQF
jgi:hypothetical protein